MAALRNATGVMLLLAGCAAAPTTAGVAAAVTPAAAPPAPTGLAPQPIPFPPGTFTGEVPSLSPPTVSTHGDLLSIRFSLGGSSPAECLLARRELGDSGSIAAVANANRSSFRLRPDSVTEISTRPPLPALFLTIHRALGAVKVAAYRRGHNLALACLQTGPAPPATFEAAVAALAAALRPTTPPAPVETWHCELHVAGGSTGWERTEITTTDDGGRALRTTAAFAYQEGDAVNLVEIDFREQENARGRVASATLTRAVNGVADSRSQLTQMVGATYRYDVTFPGQHFDGTLTAADPEGLIGTLAFTRKIKTELLTGRSPELKMQTYDPLESPETTTMKSYQLESPVGRKLLVTVAGRESHELVDENGYSLGGEFELRNGDTLLESCAPERARR